jgi:DNA-binding response OmpR family regulator
LKRYKLLAIEDEPVIVQLFRFNFELRGYDVLGCEMTEDIAGQVRREQPDLIILDILMPGKNGWLVLEELKADESTSSIPVVICSVMAKPEDRKKGKDLGAFEYVTKPFDLRELVTVVERALGLTPSETA